MSRVFISYTHESDAHAEAVRDLWIFLRANGVDAQIDRVAAQRRQDQRRLPAGFAISHGKLGALAVAIGNATIAGQHYRAALGIAERLAVADPANAQVPDDLAYFRRRLADLPGPDDPA